MKRIVDDETFRLAQDRLRKKGEHLDKFRDEKGRLKGSSPGRGKATHLLSGVLVCAGCGAPFQMAGRALKCRRAKRGLCEHKTMLQRGLAESLILDEIGRRILGDQNWFGLVLSELTENWCAVQAQQPNESRELKRQLTDLDQKIEALLDRVENGDKSPEIDARLSQRRRERGELLSRLRRVEAQCQAEPSAPTADWLREKLEQLGQTLKMATPAAAEALKELMGGKIALEEVVRPGKRQNWYRARFQISVRTLGNALGGAPGSPSAPDAEPIVEDVVLDLVAPDPDMEIRLQAFEAYQKEPLMLQIAESLGISRSKLTRLIQEECALRGLEKPDGHARRSRLAVKHIEPPKFQEIAETVKKMYDRGDFLGDIAALLNVNHATVTKAIAYWHTSRWLKAPDGRERRKSLKIKSRRRSA